MTRFRLPITTAAAFFGLSALSLAGCSREAEAPLVDNVGAVAGDDLPAPASVALTGGDGSKPGSVAVSEDPNGVTMTINAAGLAAGSHGVHLHEKGVCEGPKFASAGAHLNPAGKQHGRDNPKGAHLGDLANFVIAQGGSGSTTLMLAGVTMSGANALGDADGTSLVIHAKPDDYKTDPSGDSGDRIACAVVAGPSAMAP